MEKFVVFTGIRRFDIEAPSAQEAICQLKRKIRERAGMRKNPEIGMSLVNALAEGRLNFLALNLKGEACFGEYQGKQQEQPEPALILHFQGMLGNSMVRKARAALHEQSRSL